MQKVALCQQCFLLLVCVTGSNKSSISLLILGTTRSKPTHCIVGQVKGYIYILEVDIYINYDLHY